MERNTQNNINLGGLLKRPEGMPNEIYLSGVMSHYRELTPEADWWRHKIFIIDAEAGEIDNKGYDLKELRKHCDLILNFINCSFHQKTIAQ